MKSVKVINRSSNFSPQYTDVSFLQYVYLWAQLDTPKIFMLGRWQPGYLTKCIDLLLFPDWKFSTLCFICLIFLIPIFFQVHQEVGVLSIPNYFSDMYRKWRSIFFAESFTSGLEETLKNDF